MLRGSLFGLLACSFRWFFHKHIHYPSFTGGVLLTKNSSYVILWELSYQKSSSLEILKVASLTTTHLSWSKVVTACLLEPQWANFQGYERSRVTWLRGSASQLHLWQIGSDMALLFYRLKIPSLYISPYSFGQTHTNIREDRKEMQALEYVLIDHILFHSFKFPVRFLSPGSKRCAYTYIFVYIVLVINIVSRKDTC